MISDQGGWSVLNEKLRTPFTEKESEEVLRLQDELLDRVNALATHPENLNFAALHMARHQASNTLKGKPEELVHWETALNNFAVRIGSGEILSFDMLQEWNAILRGQPGLLGIRKEQQWLCEKALLTFEEIPTALKDFESFALNSKDPPLLKASRIYQWLITIHPFPNANGRTARLAADYILIQNGFLPLVFPTPAGSFVAISPENPTAISPWQAFLRVTRGAERSVEILQLPLLT